MLHPPALDHVGVVLLDRERRNRRGRREERVVALEERAPAVPDLRALALRARDLARGEREPRADVAREIVAELANALEAVEMIAHHRFAAQREKRVAPVREVEFDFLGRRAVVA